MSGHVAQFENSAQRHEDWTSGPVLHASAAGSFPRASLRRAHALAQSMDRTLYVLRVMQAASPTQRAIMALSMIDDISDLERFVSTARASLHMCQDVLHDGFEDELLVIEHGDLFAVASAYASQLRASLIVVPGDQASGAAVTRLARTTERPVLVARPHTDHALMIAACESLIPPRPLVSRALDVAQYFGLSVLAVHNEPPHRRRTWYERFGQLLRQRPAMARAATKTDPTNVSTVLTRTRHAAEAILDEAAAHDADLVVVGTHPRGWPRRVGRVSVARRIVERANNSVLVMPLHARNAPADTPREC